MGNGFDLAAGSLPPWRAGTRGAPRPCLLQPALS